MMIRPECPNCRNEKSWPDTQNCPGCGFGVDADGRPNAVYLQLLRRREAELLQYVQDVADFEARSREADGDLIVGAA